MAAVIDMDAPQVEKAPSEGSGRWILGNQRVPREEIVYFCQMAIITLVVIISIVNLCLKNGTESYWAAMVATGLGALLPSPKIKKRRVT